MRFAATSAGADHARHDDTLPLWHRPHLALIAGAYLLSWWPMLLNGGRYWDDWLMVGVSSHDTSLMADQMGQLWQRYYWLALSSWPGAEYIFHWLTFALFLVAAVLVYGLLRRVPEVGPTGALLLALVFAVFPVNGARFAQVNMQYTVSVALFYLSWYLLAIDLDRPSLVRRCIAALLLAAAMITTNSLLAFAVLIPAYLLWVRRKELRESSARTGFIRRYGFLLALPVAAFAFRSVALQPSGLYGGYNALTPASLLASPGLLPAAVRESFLEPIVKPLVQHPWWLLLAVPLFVVFTRLRSAEQRAAKEYLALAGIGALAFFLAVFPYLAVGKLPQAAGFGIDLWDSRHQVLVPLGAALMLFGGLMSLVRLARLKRFWALAVMAALIGGFVVADLRTSLEYQVDWYKQQSFMWHMRRSDDMRSGNLFLVEDNARWLNVMDRPYLPYEYSGMMYRVFGDSSRFAIDQVTTDDLTGQLHDYAPYRQYHWYEWASPARTFTVRVTAGDVNPDDARTMLGLLFAQCFDRAGFERDIDGIVGVSTEPRESFVPADW